MTSPDLELSIVLHPYAEKRHRPTRRRWSHFAGEVSELVTIVGEAMKDSSKVQPGKFPNTHLVFVSPANFHARGEIMPGGLYKPPANVAYVVVWGAQALAAENDPLASKCTHAIVSLKAGV